MSSQLYRKGSFLKIPKTFTIYDQNGQEVSHITKKTISFLPKFVVELKDGDRFFIHKKMTLFRDKYDIEDLGLRVQGNIWDLEFKLFDDRDQIVAEISKELFHLTSTYQVCLLYTSYEGRRRGQARACQRNSKWEKDNG